MDVNVFEMAFRENAALTSESNKPSKKVVESVARKVAKLSESKQVKEAVQLSKIRFTEDAEELSTVQPDEDIVVVYSDDIKPDMTEEEVAQAAQDLIGATICKCGICGANYIASEEHAHNDEIVVEPTDGADEEVPDEFTFTDDEGESLDDIEFADEELGESLLFRESAEDEAADAEIPEDAPAHVCPVCDAVENQVEVGEIVPTEGSAEEVVDEEVPAEDTADDELTDDTDADSESAAADDEVPVEESDEAPVKVDVDVNVIADEEDAELSKEALDAVKRNRITRRTKADVAEGLFDKGPKKGSADYTNAIKKFNSELKTLTDGAFDSVSAMGLELGMWPRNVFAAAKDELNSHEKKLDGHGNNFKNSNGADVKAVLGQYESALKDLKKPNSFYAVGSVVNRLCQHLAFKTEAGKSELADIRALLSQLNKVDKIEVDKSLYKELLAEFTKRTAYTINQSYEQLKKRPTLESLNEIAFNEKSFSMLLNKFVAENYDNVSKVEIKSGFATKTGELCFEGVVTAKSGKTRKVTFETVGFKYTEGLMKIKMIEKGPFTEAARVQKNAVPFVLECRARGGRVLPVSFKCRYTVKMANEWFECRGNYTLSENKAIKNELFGLGKKKKSAAAANGKDNDNTERKVSIVIWDENGTKQFAGNFTELSGKMSAEDQLRNKLKDSYPSILKQYNASSNKSGWSYERTSNPQSGFDTKNGRVTTLF